MSEFSSAVTLKDAKELANKILPTQQEVTVFYSGNAKCIVVNKTDMLRITLEIKDNVTCYDFK